MWGRGVQQGPLGWRGRSPLGGFFPSGETSGEEARARRRGPPVSDDGVAQTLWVPSSRPDGRAWSQEAGAGRASGRTWSPGEAERPREAGLSRNRGARGRARWAVQGAGSGSAGCSLERLWRGGFLFPLGKGPRGRGGDAGRERRRPGAQSRV